MVQLKADETLIVSGAAGAVGSLVCQLGKRVGARVIGIAGAADKYAWLENDLGVEKALNYKSPTFRGDFKKAVGYLDVYFDNVGGEILDLALSRLNMNARIVLGGCDLHLCYHNDLPLCANAGAISAYSEYLHETHPSHSRYRLRGAERSCAVSKFNLEACHDRRFHLVSAMTASYYSLTDFHCTSFDYYPHAIEVIATGLADGSIKRKFHIVQGLDKCSKCTSHALFCGKYMKIASGRLYLFSCRKGLTSGTWV